MSRRLKQILILSIFFGIIFSLIGIVYLIVKPVASCKDGKRNQGEEKIDCGGPCAPCQIEVQFENIRVEGSEFIKVSGDNYDVIIKITNPNTHSGSSSFKYQIELLDSSGATLAERSGSSFISPSETKYILSHNLNSISEPQKIAVVISDEKWKSFDNYEKPRLNIYNKRYNQISSGVGFGEAFGLLRNESLFDFNIVKIYVILRDEAGKALAANTTEIRSVRSGEERDFRVFWPNSFAGDVSRVEMEAEADVYDSLNFSKK